MTPDSISISDKEILRLNSNIQGLGGKSAPPQSSNKDEDLLIFENSTLEDSESRLKSPLKMRYSAEVEIIKKKWGDLEAIRLRLGLSQRKISQLLMVDPSAWTRWTKYENNAPPHIYRALSWFLTLQEKDPSTGNPYLWLQSVARPSLPKSELRALSEELRTVALGDTKEQQVKMNRAYLRMKWLLVFNCASLALLIAAIFFKLL